MAGRLDGWVDASNEKPASIARQHAKVPCHCIRYYHTSQRKHHSTRSGLTLRRGYRVRPPPLRRGEGQNMAKTKKVSLARLKHQKRRRRDSGFRRARHVERQAIGKSPLNVYHTMGRVNRSFTGPQVREGFGTMLMAEGTLPSLPPCGPNAEAPCAMRSPQSRPRSAVY